MHLSSYLPLLVDLMLKSAVLFAVTLMGARFARAASAANRNLIWMSVFCQVLALPFLSVWTTSTDGAARSGEEDTALVVSLPMRRTRSADDLSVKPSAESVSSLDAALRWGRDHWRDGLVGVWLGVAAALLACRAVGAVRLRGLRRRSAALDDARIAACFSRIANEHGSRLRVELRTSPECAVAMTWGTWRAVVMLPAAARDWSEHRLELVLRHELAHVARRDYLARLLGQAACALYWPNPLVWLAAKQLRLTQEQACDDRVLTAGADARAYATELLVAARTLAGRRWSDAAVAMAEPSTLTKRIVGIVEEGRERGATLRSTRLLTVVAAALALSGCTALRVRESGEAAARIQNESARSVEIQATIIQFKPDAPEAKAVLAELEKRDAYVSSSRDANEGLSPDAVSALVSDLTKRLNADLGRAPKVTVRSGQLATITVADETALPAGVGAVVATGETRASGAGTATTSGPAADFAARNVGIQMKVLPRVGSDGKIEVELAAIVTQFEGFVEFADRPAADGAVVDRAVYQPILSTREIKVVERVPSGRAILLKLGGLKRVHQPMRDGSTAATEPVPGDAKENTVLVLLTVAEASSLAGSAL